MEWDFDRIPDAPARALARALPEEVRAGGFLFYWDREGRPGALVRRAERPRAFVLDGGAARAIRFEDDRALPGRGLLADPGPAGAVFGPGPWRARLIAWRPGRRAVLALERGRGPECYVKCLRKRAYRRAKEQAALLARVTLEGLRLVTPRAFLDEGCALLFPAAPGESLHARLARGEAVAAEALARVCAALAASRAPAALPRAGSADALAAACAELERGARLLPELEPLPARLAGLRLPAGAGERFLHGDLHDKQIVLSTGAPALLDLDGARRGDPAFDLANLLEHLELRARQWRGAPAVAAASLARALAVQLPDPPPAYRTLVRARLAGVYAQRPHWWPLARELAAEVRASLAAGPA